MGKLFYDGDGTLEIPDRILFHVQIAMVAKLRRQESFTVTWNGEEMAGPSVLWVSPSIPIRFAYDGSTKMQLNRAWVEAMVGNSSQSGNLTIAAEPEAPVDENEPGK